MFAPLLQGHAAKSPTSLRAVSWALYIHTGINMSVSIRNTQINIINNYRLSAFPEDRINTLISELNVHYQKINGYIEHEISGEKVDIELIDALSKLTEISRLSPARIEDNTFSGDYRFAVEVIDSAIALAQSSSKNPAIQKKIISFGWDMLEKIYSYSFESLTNESLAYRWLKKRNLISTHAMQAWYSQPHKNDSKINFEPSDEDLEAFYQNNKQRLYEFMVFDLSRSTELCDPFSSQHKADYYHYYKTLESLNV